jgi:futalosine hydrolase
MKKVLIVTAVEAERDAVLRGLQGAKGFYVVTAGVGSATGHYGFVLSVGIGGGFAGKAEVGDITAATEIIAADLGVETAEGFRSVEELGFGSARVPVDAGLVGRVVESVSAAGLRVVTGPVLTVTTATGTAGTAAELVERVPGAVAEAMEGYGVAVAAHDMGVHILEIRAISNMVGPLNRAAWRIDDALKALEAVCSILPSLLLTEETI